MRWWAVWWAVWQRAESQTLYKLYVWHTLLYLRVPEDRIPFVPTVLRFRERHSGTEGPSPWRHLLVADFAQKILHGEQEEEINKGAHEVVHHENVICRRQIGWAHAACLTHVRHAKRRDWGPRASRLGSRGTVRSSLQGASVTMCSYKQKRRLTMHRAVGSLTVYKTQSMDDDWKLQFLQTDIWLHLSHGLPR